MSRPPTYTTWKITCESPDDARAIQLWLSSRIDLNRVLSDTTRVAPNGVEQVQTVHHRLGDYFAEIRMLPESVTNTGTFRLIFQKRPNAGRFWKDLMVNVLQELESMPLNASIELDSKGDVKPAATATKPLQK